MKWGSKGEKGCKSQTCDKIHPKVCIRSLDLKCLDFECPFKLHTFKCVRPNRPAVQRGSSAAVFRSNHEAARGGVLYPWQPTHEYRGGHGHHHWDGGLGHHAGGAVRLQGNAQHHAGGVGRHVGVRGGHEGSDHPQGGHAHAQHHARSVGRHVGVGGGHLGGDHPQDGNAHTQHQAGGLGRHVGVGGGYQGGDHQQGGNTGHHAGSARPVPQSGTAGSNVGAPYHGGGEGRRVSGGIHQDQNFQAVTAQHLLGALHILVQQMLDQGVQLPGASQGLGDRHFY